MRRFLPSVSQAVALFVGVIALLDLIGDLRTPGLDATLWLLDLRRLPGWCSFTLFSVFSGVLIAHGVSPARARWRVNLTRTVALTALFIALVNTLGFWRLVARHRLYAGFPITASLGIAALMALVALPLEPSESPKKPFYTVLSATLGLLALLSPLAIMVAFGRTDYRRPADVIVVFGARTYADGHPSDALGDRVRTACELYRQGYARRLIFSGGPGDGPTSEPQAMRNLAVSLGVSSRDILLDEQGTNTDATVANTVPMFDALGARRVLVVSHAYHLPRVKLAYHRARREVYTVPAHEGYFLKGMPFFMAREVAALWVYYGRAITARRSPIAPPRAPSA